MYTQYIKENVYVHIYKIYIQYIKEKYEKGGIEKFIKELVV